MENKEPKLVKVRIFGQEHKIKVKQNTEEKYIKAIASYVDKTIAETKKSVPSGYNAEKITILAAMNISDELFNARRGEYSFKGEVESRIESLIQRIDQVI